ARDGGFRSVHASPTAVGSDPDLTPLDKTPGSDPDLTPAAAAYHGAAAWATTFILPGAGAGPTRAPTSPRQNGTTGFAGTLSSSSTPTTARTSRPGPPPRPPPNSPPPCPPATSSPKTPPP